MDVWDKSGAIGKAFGRLCDVGYVGGTFGSGNGLRLS